MNNVELSGRITQIPEIRKAGKATVCNFSIAVSMGKGDQKKTHFFDMKTWNDNAHQLAENFRKGDMIETRSFATQESWDKDGVKRSKVVFVVTDFRAPNYGDTPQAPQTRPASRPDPLGLSGYQPTSELPPVDVNMDDLQIPF